MLKLTVYQAPSCKSWTAVTEDGREIYAGRTPHFGAARALIAEGHDPTEVIETYTPTGTLVFRAALRDLAHWTVSEPDKGGIHLIPFEPFKRFE